MTPISHTKGAYWENGNLYDSSENFLVSSFAEDGTEGMGPGSDTADCASLIARFDEVPHDCTDPACPGAVNKRKLEAFEGLWETIDRFLEKTGYVCGIEPERRALIAFLNKAEEAFKWATAKAEGRTT